MRFSPERNQMQSPMKTAMQAPGTSNAAAPGPAPPGPALPAVGFGDIRTVLGKRERRASVARTRPCASSSAALLEAALAAVEAATGMRVRTSDAPSPRALAARVARAVVLAVEHGHSPGALALGDEDAVRCGLTARAALRRRAVGPPPRVPLASS